jgi:starch-binding outer membrane protein, SusD/RagB family
MNKNKILIALFSTILVTSTSCKKQLDVSNDNQPAIGSTSTEPGLLALASGSIYKNGFYDLKSTDGVYGRFWTGATGFHEMMGDVIGVEAANAYINQLGCPNKVTWDNATVVLNPSAVNTQYALLRSVNRASQQGANPTFYEWAYMYSMIVAANTVLDITGRTKFSGDVPTKKATLQAWAYFWKGYAYSRIGSIYYAGLIQNAFVVEGQLTATNGNYVTKDAIITEANSNLDKATAALNLVTSASDYDEIISALIPDFCQVGKGGALSTAEWKRNINTIKARNILVNTPVASMTTAQWNSILTLTNAGVLPTDLIFTGRTSNNGDFLTIPGITAATIADKIQSSATSTGTYKLSERWVQEFKTGDQRRANNVRSLNSGIGLFNTDRGNSFNTRYTLRNKGLGLAGVVTYANTDEGANEITLCGTYEENALMKAEALIRIGGQANIDAAVLLINDVRNYQGAGLTNLGAGLTAAVAYEELRRERRIGLAFKGLSFYDARRWDIIDPSKSRTGCVLITPAGVVNTNATINYGFLDYWDVPDNELAYNPAASGSAPVKNPKQ